VRSRRWKNCAGEHEIYQVILSRTAREFFDSAATSLQRRLDRCFAQLTTEPRRHPNIKPLRGPLAGYLRYRVGDYRIVYTIDDARNVVTIAMIAHRRSVYD
jgi:mRNA interferase RelE/StbE